jgi:hypothetical protein
MNVRRLTTAALAIGLAASTAPRLRAQSITFSFGDRDRQTMREWYRQHYTAPEFQARRWNTRYEQGLRVGLVLGPELRAWARPAPADLSGRLPPPPAGYRYMIVGDHLVVVDRGWRIYEVNHFETFDAPDQQVMREWYTPNRDARIFSSRGRWNDRLERRLVVGATLGPNMQNMAVPVPPDLRDRLPRRPRYLRYLAIGDHVVLVDRWWTIREVFHFERDGHPNGR